MRSAGSSRGGRTERLEKPLPDQCPCWSPVASATPRYLCKVRRSASQKAIQNQTLTSSVLNPRSREVWRQTAGERQFRVSAGAPQSGGFRAKPVVIGLLCALRSQRRMLVAEGLAEREGFEPPIRLPVCRISSAVHSTTLPPLHSIEEYSLRHPLRRTQ